MPEPKRPIDHVARQNLMYVVQACARALGKVQGGQSYLAELLGSRPQYMSSVVKGYEGRNLGREFKAKIEHLFKLVDGWMDTPHGPEVVLKLVPKVPPKPPKLRQPKTRPHEVAALREEIRDLRETVNDLRTRLDQLSRK